MPCHAVHWGRKILLQWCTPGWPGWGAALLRKPLGYWRWATWAWASRVLLAAEKVSSVLGCIKPSRGPRDWGKLSLPPPDFSALIRPHLEYSVQFWHLKYKKYSSKVERVQQKPTKMVGSRSNCPKERLRELSLISLEKRWLQGDLTLVPIGILARRQSQALCCGGKAERQLA